MAVVTKIPATKNKFTSAPMSQTHKRRVAACGTAVTATKTSTTRKMTTTTAATATNRTTTRTAEGRDENGQTQTVLSAAAARRGGYMGVHRRLSSQANVSASAIKSYILSTARPGDMLRIEKKGDIQPHTVVIRSISDSGVEFYTYGSPFEYYNGPQIVTKPWTWFASKLISADKTYTTSYFLYQMKDKIYNESGGSSIGNGVSTGSH